MWSQKHKCCIKCNTIETPHKAKGLCVNCYHQKWRDENREKVRESSRKYEKSEKRKEWRKKYQSTPEYKEYIRQKAREYRERNTELCRERTRKWREENRDHIIAYNEARKDVRLVKKYGEDALRKMLECNRKCEKCGSGKRVAIHHIDWNPTNNVYENFSILCGGCHSKIHSWIPKRLRKEIFEEWMKTPLEVTDGELRQRNAKK